MEAKTARDFRPKVGSAKGILSPDEGKRYFTVNRYEPSEDIAFFVEHYWIVAWALPENTKYRQEVLSYPAVHIVFEHGNTRIFGVITTKYTRTLEGTGHVLGIKFRPGGFYPFLQRQRAATPTTKAQTVGQPAVVAAFSDKTLLLGDVFSVDVPDLEQRILTARDHDAMMVEAERFLREHLPDQDADTLLVGEIVDTIQNDRRLTKVDQIADMFGMSKRSLQRLFQRYVGVTPKWVINRFRLHEVAAALVENPKIRWSVLAKKLGYFDQAHFINDFRAIVGQTPTAYARSVRR